MKKWFCASELAGLPGMPKTVQGVGRKAKRDRYIAKYRNAQGGGLEYHFSCFPEETRDALHFDVRENLPVPAINQDLVAQSEIKQDLTSLKKWQRDIMTSRLVIYREFEALAEQYGTTKAVKKLVAMAKNGILPAHLQQHLARANARGGKNSRTLSRSTLLRWHRDVREQGISALAPQKIEKNTVPAWAPYWIQCFQQPQKPSIPEAMAELARILPPEIPMPSYSQVRRFNDKRSRLEREKGRNSASALKRFRGYCRRSTDNLQPLDVVQCDGHSFKAKVANPFHGRPFKPEVCAVMDVKTRLCLGWSSGLAESSQTVADALRHSMTVNDAKPFGGVPAILYTDQGAGNMANMLNDEVTGILSRAGTVHHTGIPGNAQGRGMIEKANQRLWISAARRLQTFVGRGMDELEKRRVYLLTDKEVRQTGTCMISELPTWENFLEICRQAMLEYNSTPHSGLQKIKDTTGHIRHMTPYEAWFTAIREGWQPTLLDPSILNDLFRPQVVRKTRRAQVELFGKIYFNPILEHYHGADIVAEYDIHDPENIRVRDTNQRLICMAQLDRNKRDFFPIPEVERARDQRAKRRLDLVDRKRDEIIAERDGYLQIEADNTFLIEADAGAVDRVLGNDDFCPPPETTPEPEPERQATPAARLYTSKSDKFNDMLSNLRATGRSLTMDECDWLTEYYQEDGGRMYLALVGDLRAEFGVDESMDFEGTNGGRSTGGTVNRL